MRPESGERAGMKSTTSRGRARAVCKESLSDRVGHVALEITSGASPPTFLCRGRLGPIHCLRCALTSPPAGRGWAAQPSLSLSLSSFRS